MNKPRNKIYVGGLALLASIVAIIGGLIAWGAITGGAEEETCRPDGRFYNSILKEDSLFFRLKSSNTQSRHGGGQVVIDVSDTLHLNSARLTHYFPWEVTVPQEGIIDDGYSASWSHDGEHIVFPRAYVQPDGEFGDYSSLWITSRTEEEREVVHIEGLNLHANFSFDNNRLIIGASLYREGEIPRIFVFDLTDGELTEVGRGYYPLPTHDGRITFSLPEFQGERYFVINEDGGEQEEIDKCSSGYKFWNWE